MITAVIPTFNESRYIRQLICETEKHVDMVIVADDHSTDNTRELAARECLVVLNTGPKGVGRNTATGIAVALMFDTDIVVTLDGDGQHDPNDIPTLLRCLEYCDIAIGTRDWTTMPKYRRLGNSVINLAYNLFGTQLPDTQTGFRAYKRRALENIRWEENGFGFATETLIKARKMNLKVAQVPIHVVYHNDLRENSSMNPVKHGVGVLLKTLKWRWWELNA